MASKLMDAIQQKGFLGTEFLTWVWFRGETGEGSFEMAGPGEFEIEMDNAVTIADEADADVRQASIKGDAPGPSEMLKRSVAEGKKILRAKFRVIWQNVVWTCQINGETLDVGGVKLPTSAPQSGGNIGEHIRLRLEYMEGFLELWDSLYEYYLALRLDQDRWAEEAQRLGEWLRDELKDL